MKIEMDPEAAREDAEMRTALAEFREAARIARDEPCGDEHHCTCVPLLRAAVKDAEGHATACQKYAIRAQTHTAALAAMIREILAEGSTTWGLRERAEKLLGEVGL